MSVSTPINAPLRKRIHEIMLLDSRLDAQNPAPQPVRCQHSAVTLTPGGLVCDSCGALVATPFEPTTALASGLYRVHTAMVKQCP